MWNSHEYLKSTLKKPPESLKKIRVNWLPLNSLSLGSSMPKWGHKNTKKGIVLKSFYMYDKYATILKTK